MPSPTSSVRLLPQRTIVTWLAAGQMPLSTKGQRRLRPIIREVVRIEHTSQRWQVGKHRLPLERTASRSGLADIPGLRRTPQINEFAGTVEEVVAPPDEIGTSSTFAVLHLADEITAGVHQATEALL